MSMTSSKARYRLPRGKGSSTKGIKSCICIKFIAVPSTWVVTPQKIKKCMMPGYAFLRIRTWPRMLMKKSRREGSSRGSAFPNSFRREGIGWGLAGTVSAVMPHLQYISVHRSPGWGEKAGEWVVDLPIHYRSVGRNSLHGRGRQSDPVPYPI